MLLRFGASRRAVPSGRDRLLLDKSWRFALGHAANPALDFEFVRDRSLVKAGEARGAAGVAFDDKKWRSLDLPHDWAIELPFDPRGDKELAEHGFYAIGPDHPEHSVGWYRRRFTIPKSDLGRRIGIEFDGVFRDSIVWLNGHRMGRHASGYTPFRYDVTDVINYGGENVVAVRVDASNWEGWWYEGAGIYRHVWLVKTDPLHVAPDGTFITSEVGKKGTLVTIRTTIVNESDDPTTFVLTSEVSQEGAEESVFSRSGAATLEGSGSSRSTAQTPASERVFAKTRIAFAKSRRTKIAPWDRTEVTQTLAIKNPALWSPDAPNLYQLRSAIQRNGKEVDTYDTTFGIRTLRWDAKKGLFLNGQPIKIQGTCNHRDHAGVGVALPDRLHVLRIENLKELGCNAFRASHYPHARELLDACDRLGLMVMAENRLAGSSPEVLGQLQAMIRRDRNHPSIVLWSLANEEHTVQWSITGERIGRSMVRLCHKLDPTREVTAAMHDKGLGVGFANIVDVHGWNYIRVGNIDKFHKKHPDRVIIGSEEGSTVCTRGVYADDAPRGYVSAYDKRAPSWGSTAETWLNFFAKRDWLAGGFVWTGFDHRGEPIPYKWPCTLSHFGIMDLCGFPKDNYYFYKSWWKPQETTLHLFPHWNWPGFEGREIDVRVFSNCDEVELLHNDKSLGRRTVPRNSHLAWNVIYEPGTLEAFGYRGGQCVSTATVATTGPPARILLSSDRPSINADGEDVASVTVSVVDDAGRAVPTADNLVRFELSGPGKILGVGNGDPSSHESEIAPHRSLFNGLALVLVQATTRAGEIRLTARAEGGEGGDGAEGVEDAKMVIQSVPCARRSSVE